MRSACLRRLLVLLAVPLVAAACAKAPEPVHWGVESCAHCQMVISDARYAAQVVDQRGRTFKFDAIECMTAFLRNGTVAAADVHSVWVASGRDDWIPAETAAYVHSSGIRSPMGGGLAALETREAATALQAQVGGSVLAWSEVLQLEPTHTHTGAQDHGAH